MLGRFEFSGAVASEGIIIVPNGYTEGGEAVALVKVEVLEHAVAVVGEHEKQLPVDDVFEVEIVTGFMGKGAVVGMDHELHELFHVVVSVVVFNVGIVLLEVVARLLHPSGFQSVFAAEKGRVFENHGRAVAFVEAERSCVEFLHEHVKAVVGSVEADGDIGALRSEVFRRVHLPEKVEADLVPHHGLVDVVGVEDEGALLGKAGQRHLVVELEGV